MGKFMMTMTLQPQGKLTASSKTDHGSRIKVLPFTFGVTSPRDQATGQASGKRQHKPITIIKEVDSASPLIWQAAANNETLKTVSFSVATGAGNRGGSNTIALIDVEIVEVLHFGLYEQVTLAFDAWVVNGVPGGILDFLLEPGNWEQPWIQ